MDESTRCVPDRGRAAVYRRAQKVHDALSADLRRVFDAR
jgi:hypothetical protein